jgi:S-adenosylhomocysteine hydrolase
MGLKLLSYYIQQKNQREITRKILGKYILLLVLHFTPDLRFFLSALEKLGSRPKNTFLLAKPYLYPEKDRIAKEIKNNGYHLFMPSAYPLEEEVKKMVSKAVKMAKRERRKLLILEDGGYIVPLLHRDFVRELRYCRGAVEQTTKGIKRDRKIGKKRGRRGSKRIKIPIMNVAECEFKRTYEPPIIGPVIVRCIRDLLPATHLRGKRALIIGFGPMGKSISKHLYQIEGMKIYVAEKKVKLWNKKSHFVTQFVRRASDVIHKCNLIVGTTGNKSIGWEEISKLSHNCILVSASSDQDEIDIDELKRCAGDETNIRRIKVVGTKYKIGGKEVILLADGYPINFFHSRSIPNESVDPILSALFLSLIEVAYHKIRPGIHTRRVDTLLQQEKLVERFKTLYGIPENLCP